MCILENGEIEIMDLAIIAAKQVLEMFLMILAGFICFKTGVIKEEGKKALSDLLLYLVVPAMIVNSYLVEHDSSMTGNLVRMLIYSILMVGTGLVITYAVLFSKKNKDRGIMRFACGFSNAAYMGFPLIQALFGAEGILYASVYVTVYNILLWTVGYSFVTKKVNVKGDCKEYTYGTVYNCCVYRTYFIWIKCACAGYYRHSAFNDCRNKYTGFNDYYRCNYCGQQYDCSFKKQASV